VDIPLPHVPCYLAEWYSPTLTGEQLDHTAALLEECAASMSGEGSSVQLLTMLAVPDDEVVFGVFAAGSAHVVDQTCRRAGIPIQRLTAAVDARIPGKC
jgi:hypothetical protein